MHTDSPSPSVARTLALPLLALVAALTLAFVVFSPRLLPAEGSLAQLAAFGVVGVALVGYLIGYRRLLPLGDTAVSRRVLLFGAVPLWALAVVVPPFDSVDLHSYTNIGWVQVGYGQNPYATPVSSVPGWHLDPLFNVWWSDKPCAYSFLFAREAAAVVRAAGPDKPAILLAFKLVNVVALALTLWVVAVGCRRLGASQSLALYLIAWNPLVLLHGLSNGHNDVLSGLGLAAALLFAGGRLWWLTMTALAAAALIKYSTVPLVPLAALFLARRHGWVRMSLSLLPAAAFTAWAAWPYLADGGAHKLADNLSNITDYIGSVGSIIVIPIRSLGPEAWEPVVANVLKFAGGLLVLGLVGWLGVKRLRQGEYGWPELVRDAVLVQVALIAVASAKFYGWYVLMFWPVVAWLPAESRLRRACLALGFAQCGSLTAIARAHILSPLVLIVAPLWWVFRQPLAALPSVAKPQAAQAA